MSRVHSLSLDGLEFGRWKVLRLSHKNKYGEKYWLCQCACGTIKTVVAASLTKGTSISCGCYKNEFHTTHGKHAENIYDTWSQMKARCENPNHAWYYRYGGRGITVCEEWSKSFVNFYQAMGDKPDGLSLDRIDNNGNYEPGNCRWSSQKEQIRNREISKYIEFNGVSKPLAQWAEEYGIKRKKLAYRLKQGWDIKDALTKPHSGRWGEIKAKQK